MLQVFRCHPPPLAGPVVFEVDFGYVAQVARSLVRHAEGLEPPACIHDITLERASPASCRAVAPPPTDGGGEDGRPPPRGRAGPGAARPFPARH